MDSESNDILSNLYDDNDDSDSSESESDADTGLAGTGLNDSDISDMLNDSTPSPDSSSSYSESASKGDSSEGSSIGSESSGATKTVKLNVITPSESANELHSADAKESTSAGEVESETNPKHMDSASESYAKAHGTQTASESASSEINSAFNPAKNIDGREDTNDNAANVQSAGDDISQYNQKAKKQGLVDDDQVADMKDFCENIKQIVVNFTNEFQYDSEKLNQQATALYDNANAMKHGGKSDEVKEVQAWIQTGTPQQLSKLTHQMAQVVNDPRFKAFLAEDKDSGKTPKATRPQRNIDEKMHDKSKAIADRFLAEQNSKNDSKKGE